MAKLNKATKRTAVIVALLILLAIFLRIMNQYLPPNNLRGLIYIGLFAAWGISVRRRILQLQVRRYLTAVSVLMVFWVAVRSVKFLLVSDLPLARYCWYSYYFPMLFIPLLMLLVALSLGKPESFRLPKWINFLFFVTAALFVLVLTNDFHQIVFSFPRGLRYFENSDYSHELIYYLSVGWIAVCAVSALSVMILKCHIPDNRKRIWLPSVPVLMLILYAVLYLTAWDFVKPLAGDMTVVCCLLITATLESCIQCGLIQSNTYYSELFECSGIRARITDEDYNLLLSSTDTEPLSKDMLRRAERSPVILDDGFRLCGAPIKKGHVVWSEDVSEMTEVLSELADNSEYLTTRRSVLHKEVQTRRKEQRLIEQNRLYNRLIHDNREKYALFSDLISQLEAADDNEQEKKLTAKLAVVCTHIKRRGNLLFLAENGEKINASELRFALEEWMTNLRLCTAKCTLFFNLDAALSFSQAIALYDTFQWILLHTLDTLHSLLVTADGTAAEPCLILNLSCDCDLSEVSYPGVDISDENNGEWVITIKLLQGGVAV